MRSKTTQPSQDAVLLVVVGLLLAVDILIGHIGDGVQLLVAQFLTEQRYSVLCSGNWRAACTCRARHDLGVILRSGTDCKIEGRDGRITQVLLSTEQPLVDSRRSSSIHL